LSQILEWGIFVAAPSQPSKDFAVVRRTVIVISRASLATAQLPPDPPGQRKKRQRELASAAELRKAQREVKAFHRFRQLRQQLLEVKEQICRVLASGTDLVARGKKRPQRSGRKSRPLLRVVFGDRHKSGGRDLEAIKMAVRSLCIRPEPQR
jgi:hypothetical protein